VRGKGLKNVTLHKTPTPVRGRGFSGVRVGVQEFVPRGYPCSSLPMTVGCWVKHKLSEPCANIFLVTLPWNSVSKWLEGVETAPFHLFSCSLCLLVAVSFSMIIYFIPTIQPLDKTE
jgi:hypothetical protein